MYKLTQFTLITYAEFLSIFLVLFMCYGIIFGYEIIKSLGSVWEEGREWNRME